MILPRRKRVITLHMRSGATTSIVCSDASITKSNGNELTALGVNGGQMPFYTRLDAVELITVRRSWLHWEVS